MDSERPWMTALEMQFTVLRSAHRVLANIGAKEASLRFACEGAVQLLPQAEAYSWSGESSAAVAAAARSMPDASTLHVEDLPSPVSFWWFDDPVPVALPDPGLSKRVGREIGAIVIGPTDMEGRLALIVHRFVHPPDGQPPTLMPTSVYAIPRDATLAHVRDDVQLTPEGRSDDDSFRLRRGYEVMRFVIAATAWLRQRILVTRHGHIERHRRRALAREFDAPVPSDVQIIELRRLESDTHAPRDPNAEPVEWSCRWLVAGHWRLQPYKDGRRPIYIHPFVKGPADKPLRVPTHRVYVVDR